MNTPNTRIIYTSIPDPCGSLDYLKPLVLYSLLVSHGIRIDTRLVISSSKYVLVLDGFNQKYLHAQDKSLEKYLARITCEKISYPGVYFYSKRYSLLSPLSPPSIITIITNRKTGQFSRPNPMPHSYFVITSEEEVIDQMVADHVLLVDAANELSLINTAHYLLDTWHGAWIRRMGWIDWFSPAARRY